MIKKATIFATALAALLSTNAFAYKLETVFASSKFAVNQVILEEDEKLETLQNTITKDSQNLLKKKGYYQTSTAIFPTGSMGFRGKINQQMLAVLTISNYGTEQDSIVFNKNANTASEGGLYISFDQLKLFVDNKVLNPLISELQTGKLPIVMTNVPVSAVGMDIKGNFYISATNVAQVVDAMIVDSAYYPMKEIYKIRPGCTVSFLGFVDRLVNAVPAFLSMHASINNIDCSKAATNGNKQANTKANNNTQNNNNDTPTAPVNNTTKDDLDILNAVDALDGKSVNNNNNDDLRKALGG